MDAVDIKLPAHPFSERTDIFSPAERIFFHKWPDKYRIKRITSTITIMPWEP